MIRIGLFSKLSQVPVKTLRYYDEIGLLEPAEIDRFTSISEAYEAVVKWIETNGYQFNGSSREIYLQLPAKIGDQNDPDTVTEIQFPVVKA